ncbi:GNAT family N-acetyltransferase [Actinoplanes sp. NPDC051494]|uniref:GNAT family N-acetyltransferase n=1 Tax=Actinoplanes sp. NPDC051494 TaxID=3363907 RepID=UPI0037BDCAE1
MDIAFLPPGSPAAPVTALINQVYADGEKGLWRAGAARTTEAEVASLIERGEIAVARREGRVIGTVRVQQLAPGLGEFGQLSADPAERGTGVGRELVRFAENWARDRDLPTMQLELLTPDDWEHPVKEFLRAWYTRIGYRVVGTMDIATAHPELAPLLAGPATLLVFHKEL